jgi:hypothetical protein
MDEILGALFMGVCYVLGAAVVVLVSLVLLVPPTLFFILLFTLD